MKRNSFNKLKNLHTHFIGAFLLCILTLIICSCSKDLPEDSKYYKLDKEIYFTLTAGTDTFTTYGFSYNKYGLTYDGPEIIIIRDADSSTPAQTDLLLEVNEVIFEGSGNGIVFSMGNCFALWSVTKADFELTGNYKLLLGTDSLKDFRTLRTNKEYYLDQNGFSFNILKQDILHNKLTVEGNFTCTLHLAANPYLTIPATGAFKAYVK